MLVEIQIDITEMTFAEAFETVGKQIRWVVKSYLNQHFENGRQFWKSTGPKIIASKRKVLLVYRVYSLPETIHDPWYVKKNFLVAVV